MALQDNLRALREFDFASLDYENIGNWPKAAKAAILAAVVVAVAVLGYFYHVKSLREDLARVTAREADLRREFENKAFQAANLDAYKRQMVEMEESFGALVSQLPSETEVPGLLEDITNKALQNGLDITSIELQAEVAREFYIELPIAIVASGSYHDIGAFVSSMAALPRIVTLHDFTIKQERPDGTHLSVSLTARTYRYRDEGV
jgi:type IV pilus assembly protein PilO